VVGLLGLLGLGVMVVRARELSPTMYQGGFLLAAALSAVVIASVSRAPHSLLARGLSWRPVVAAGVVSYGLYLWHWPVYVVLTEERTGLAGSTLLGVRVLVTAALAVLSYQLVERPIRQQRLQQRLTRTQWRRAVTAATAGVVVITLVSTASAEPPGLAQPTSAVGTRPAPVPDASGRITDAFLLGDSQSFSLRQYYGNRVDGLAVNGSTQLGCGTLLAERNVDGETRPNIPACATWEPRWTEEIARLKPDLVLLMLGLGELYDRQVGDTVVRFGAPEHRDWLYREIDRRREAAEATGGRFALTTVLCHRVKLGATGRDGQIANDPVRLAWLNQAIDDYADLHPEARVVDLHGIACSSGYTETMDGVQLRDDGLHLNEQGAALVWQRLGPMLVAAAR